MSKVSDSRAQEERIAKLLGGRRLPRSGGMFRSEYTTQTAGGDLVTEDFLVEHKMTEKASISLKQEWLRKVKVGAELHMKDPAVCITFTGRVPEDWVLVPLAVFKRLNQ